MALHDEEDNNTQGDAPDNRANRFSAENQQDSGQRGQSSSSNKERVSGVRSFMNDQLRPFSSDTANETVQKLAEVFNAFLENEVLKQDPAWQLYRINGESAGLAKSALVLVYSRQQEGREIVAYNTMVVEGDSRLPSRVIQINGVNVDTFPVTGDVTDKVYRNYVDNFVRNQIGNRNADFIEAGANVIYSEVDLKDQASLRAIFMNAINSCWHALVANKVIVERKFNADAIGRGDKLEAVLNWTPQSIKQTSGLPVRSDISVCLQAVTQQNAQSQIDQQIGLVQADGFIDLVYTPSANNANTFGQQFSFGQQNQMRDTRSFTPRFVITSIKSLRTATDVVYQLLGLATTSVLTEKMAGTVPWINAFMGQHGIATNEPDPRDVGALTYLVNLSGDPQAKPKALDTRSNKFTDRDRQQYLSALIFPELIYSIDVDEAGDQSYLNLAFLGAARGSREMHDHVVAMANTLTNGAFGKIFPTSEPLFIDDNNRIFTGYYMSKGERKDLRCIDNLAMMNLIGGNADGLIYDWMDTFDHSSTAPELRIAKRKQILDVVLPGQYQIKGYAQRLTCHPKLIPALALACREGGLAFVPKNLGNVSGPANHGISNANTQFGVAAHSSGLFTFNTNQGGFGGGMPNLGFSGFSSR